MEGNGWHRARELQDKADNLRVQVRALEADTARLRGEGHQLRQVLRDLNDAAGEFLKLVDVEMDLDDPTHPLHDAADRLEDHLQQSRDVL